MMGYKVEVMTNNFFFLMYRTTVAQVVKNLLAMLGTWVQSLG